MLKQEAKRCSSFTNLFTICVSNLLTRGERVIRYAPHPASAQHSAARRSRPSRAAIPKAKAAAAETQAKSASAMAAAARPGAAARRARFRS